MSKPERRPGEFFGSRYFAFRWWWITLPLSTVGIFAGLLLMLLYCQPLFWLFIGWHACVSWRDNVRQQAKDDMRNWIKRRLHV